MAACWYTMLVCPTQDSTAVWQSTQWLDGTEQPITSSISKSCSPWRVNNHWWSQCLVTKSLKIQHLQVFTLFSLLKIQNSLSSLRICFEGFKLPVGGRVFYLQTCVSSRIILVQGQTWSDQHIFSSKLSSTNLITWPLKIELRNEL